VRASCGGVSRKRAPRSFTTTLKAGAHLECERAHAHSWRQHGEWRGAGRPGQLHATHGTAAAREQVRVDLCDCACGTEVVGSIRLMDTTRRINWRRIAVQARQTTTQPGRATGTERPSSLPPCPFPRACLRCRMLCVASSARCSTACARPTAPAASSVWPALLLPAISSRRRDGSPCEIGQRTGLIWGGSSVTTHTVTSATHNTTSITDTRTARMWVPTPAATRTNARTWAPALSTADAAPTSMGSPASHGGAYVWGDG
jgi:hypothetical protein